VQDSGTCTRPASSPPASRASGAVRAGLTAAYAENAGLSWTSADDHLTLSVFGCDLSDEEYRVYDLDFIDSIVQAFGPPRQPGGLVRWRS
jgi:hypothetical protein